MPKLRVEIDPDYEGTVLVQSLVLPGGRMVSWASDKPATVLEDLTDDQAAALLAAPIAPFRAIATTGASTPPKRRTNG